LAKIPIGIKVDPKFKEILQEAARDENRSLSNFIIHCLLTYLKDQKGIDFKEENYKANNLRAGIKMLQRLLLTPLHILCERHSINSDSRIAQEH
jgi:hypothetical protein